MLALKFLLCIFSFVALVLCFKDSADLSPASGTKWSLLASFSAAEACPDDPSIDLDDLASSTNAGETKLNPPKSREMTVNNQKGTGIMTDKATASAPIPRLRVPLIRTLRVERTDPTLISSPGLNPAKVPLKGTEKPPPNTEMSGADIDNYYYNPQSNAAFAEFFPERIAVDLPEVAIRAVSADRIAVVLVDTWDKHWCFSAETRLQRLYRDRMAPWLARMREAGAKIVFAPLSGGFGIID
jgi:hypothetical protein